MNKTKAYGICLYRKKSNSVKILLCKSVSSLQKWGFLKGVQEKKESNTQTAIREFQEECGIKIDKKYLEKYFEQKNTNKDICIYMVNYDNISNINTFFVNDKLLSNHLSWENIQVKFFDIEKLPEVKMKQEKLTNELITYLKRK